MNPVAEAGAFLDAIRANPADDTVRLVFADWLDEHGNDPVRAAVIRGMMSYPGRTWVASRHSLVSRQEIWHFNETSAPGFPSGGAARLREELPAPDRVPSILTFTFRRGFVEAVRLPWGAWCRENSADVLRAVYPLTRVDLTDEPDLSIWRHEPRVSHAWVYGAWVSAPHDAVPPGVSKSLFFCGLRWPGVVFTSPRSR